MPKRIVLSILLSLALLLFLVAGLAVAMQSTNYELSWYTLEGGGGGQTGSSSYEMDFIIGQTVIGSGLSSSSYEMGLGFYHYSQTPIETITIEGPQSGFINTTYYFTGTVGPNTASLPVQFEWQDTANFSNTEYDLSDSIAFDWVSTGTKTILLTASNIPNESISATHAITIQSVPPVTAGQTIVYTDGRNLVTTVETPSSPAISQTRFIYIPLLSPSYGISSSLVSLQSFILTSTPQLTSPLNQPLTLTLEYDPQQIAGMKTNSLQLYHWNGTAWTDTGVTLLQPASNGRIVFSVDYLAEFVLIGEASQLRLPLIYNNQ